MQIPRYCNGNCHALNKDAMLEIYAQARITNRNEMRIEDKYFTGILSWVFISISGQGFDLNWKSTESIFELLTVVECGRDSRHDRDGSFR